MASVLIVDDHAGFRAAAKRLLEIEGFDVVGEAHDASSAVVEARRLEPDLVLLDVHLPDNDGFAVAGELTTNGGGPIVLLISSHDASDFGPLIASSGARGFIPKSELSGGAIRELIDS